MTRSQNLKILQLVWLQFWEFDCRNWKKNENEKKKIIELWQTLEHLSTGNSEELWAIEGKIKSLLLITIPSNVSVCYIFFIAHQRNWMIPNESFQSNESLFFPCEEIIKKVSGYFFFYMDNRGRLNDHKRKNHKKKHPKRINDGQRMTRTNK